MQTIKKAFGLLAPGIPETLTPKRLAIKLRGKKIVDKIAKTYIVFVI